MNEDEVKYVRDAVQAGNVPLDRMVTNLMLARLHEKKPLEIQSMYMDVYVGAQRVLREL